jgi:hypothetical protein
VLQPFVTKHTNYFIKGTLSSSFLKLVAVAETIFLLVDLDSTKVPCKQSTKPTPKAMHEPEDGDLMALLAKTLTSNKN